MDRITIKLISGTFLIFAFLYLVILYISENAEQWGFTTTPHTDEETFEVETRVFERVNAIRSSNGLDELAWDEDLANISRAHSLDMAEREYFDHYNPEGEGPTERAARHGIDITTELICTLAACEYLYGIGENIGFQEGLIGTPDYLAHSMVEGWMDSSGHRANILNPTYSRTGIGVVRSVNNYYFTQDFQ